MATPRQQSIPATPAAPQRKVGARFTGAAIRLARPLLKVNLLGYRVEIENALFPEGPPAGEVPGPDPVRLLFIGDIAVSSYNVLNHGLGLASQTSRFVARQQGIGCSWSTISDSELTMARAARAVNAEALQADAVIIVLGPPDVLLGTPHTEWSNNLARIVEAVRHSAKPDSPVIVAAIPPMHRFRAMPIFVRRILAVQIQRLDRASVAVAASHPGVFYSPFPGLSTADAFIEDAFNWRAIHSHWGKQLGAATARELAPNTVRD
ncbi:SGNH/GDSL hydrolase family protein [Salinibacterium sp. M195]|uniref:SGNH/GDSL hydrolase family protein n=1 Tax=Salinibacterium sp. M195 TaxID=2583374 RepID=UPI002104C74C|nr:SGNH/GDSL hydrolase family protein [Salinibacterium sp. M195]